MQTSKTTNGVKVMETVGNNYGAVHTAQSLVEFLELHGRGFTPTDNNLTMRQQLSSWGYRASRAFAEEVMSIINK